MRPLDAWTRLVGPLRPGFLFRGRPPAPPPWGEAVERVDGHPLLRLRGSPARRGRAAGRELRPQVEHVLRHYLDPFVGTGVARERFLRRARSMEARLRDAEREELRGLVEGSRQPDPDRVLLGQAFLDLHKAMACSTVLVRDRRSGRLLLGRNLDFASFGVAHRVGVVLVHHPDDGIPFVSVGWPGLLGALSGMNRDGLAIALNLVYGERDVDDGVPVGLALQRVLLRARDLDEAHEALRTVRFASSNNLTVADGRGRAAVFEVGPDRLVRRDPRDGALHATNHFATCRRVPRLSPMSVSSHLRHALLALGRRTFAEAGSLRATRRALGRVGLPWITLQSMVFDPAAREIHLSMGRVPAARGRFVRLDGDTLWGWSKGAG